MRAKTEIVVFGEGQLAIRKTSGIFFRSYTYLDLDNGTWRDRNNTYFRDCLTTDMNKIKRHLLLHGNDTGVPYHSDTNELSITDLNKMNQLANKGDAGMKDLLQQVKSYLILKGE